MGASGDYCIEWHKLDSERKISHSSCYVESKKKDIEGILFLDKRKVGKLERGGDRGRIMRAWI